MIDNAEGFTAFCLPPIESEVDRSQYGYRRKKKWEE